MSRARQIVKLAEAASATTAEFFREDAVGFWEKRAAEYLITTAPQAAEFLMTPEQVDAEIASQLHLEALDGLITRAEKGVR